MARVRDARRQEAVDVAEAWKAQVSATLRFLEKLHATPTMHGEAWRRKMLAHYSRSASALLEEVPLGCKSAAKRAKGRLRAVLS